jgi:hypothetical protein
VQLEHGLLTTLGGGQATALLAAWVAVFVLGTGWRVRRRDIT